MTQELEQRINRVEIAVSAIPDIRDSLKAIENTSIETQKTLAAMVEFNTHSSARMNEQGKALDKLVPKVTQIHSKVDTHDWIIKRIGGAVIVAIVGAIALLLRGQ